MTNSKSKKFSYVFALLLILVLGSWLAGLRLGPISAGRADISRGAVMLRQISFGKSETVDIFQTSDGYATTLVRKWGPFWYNSKKTLTGKANSEINIISFISFYDPKSGSGTVFAVLSNDKNVSYLSAGPNKLKQDIKPHVLYVLSWNQPLDPISLNAVAYSNDNKALYKIKNAKITNGVGITIPIKFYPVNQ